MLKEDLMKSFPRLKKDIEDWWHEECRNAYLLGCFDRVYGVNHPRRREFIRLLEKEPDEFTRETGVPLLKQIKGALF